MATSNKFLAASDKRLLNYAATFASFHLFASSLYSRSIRFGGRDGGLRFPAGDACGCCSRDLGLAWMVLRIDHWL